MHLHYFACMPAVIDAKSTLTVRYQTTVPPAVRQALKLVPRDKVLYSIQPDGTVILARANSQGDSDPIVDSFLQVLAQDMTANPRRLKPIDAGLVRRIRSLTKGVKVDLDAPLAGDE
jgi:antitoxin PrlF